MGGISHRDSLSRSVLRALHGQGWPSSPTHPDSSRVVTSNLTERGGRRYAVLCACRGFQEVVRLEGGEHRLRLLTQGLISHYSQDVNDYIQSAPPIPESALTVALSRHSPGPHPPRPLLAPQRPVRALPDQRDPDALHQRPAPVGPGGIADPRAPRSACVAVPSGSNHE